MDLALAVLLLWGLLFVPLGIILHWLVLGEGSRVRALPLAPITGLAAAFGIVATLGRLGIDAGEPWVAIAFAAVSVACTVLIWRRGVEWRSRELVGAGLLLLFAVMLVQLSVVGADGDGPLGYGTSADPVAEVAAIDAAAGGPASELGVANEASDTADERAIGFEQFAALTVALGVTNDAQDDDSWTAYGLHATITGMLAALVTLPIFAFARARGVRWLGLVVLVPLGVLAPAVFLSLANGEGAAIASVAFTTAAGFSLLVTRRDRGWWALVMLYGSAIAATAGPIALLPLLSIGIAWMLLRSDTYEHLSQHDAPVGTIRTLVATGIAAGLGGVATVPLLASQGEQLSWTALHDTMGTAVRSWPFSWLDTNLMTAGPDGALEFAIWLIGPALLAVAAIYAIVRNERRELGVLFGALLAAGVALAVGLFNTDAGIRLFEFTALSMSPFLAALAIRAVALARENAAELRGTKRGRWAGVGPTVLVVTFVIISFAATTVTGTRMVHAPAVDVASAAPDGETAIIAAGDPWLAFVVDGERVTGGYADADAISEERSEFSDFGTRTTGYDQVIVSSSPLSSDPSLRYLEQSDYDQYQVRLFRDLLSGDELTPDLAVDTARLTQRTQTQTADRPGTEGTDTAATSSAPSQPAAGEPSDAAAAAATIQEAANAKLTIPIAQVHVPVEGSDANTPADRPAGRLLPAGDVVGCSSSRDSLAPSTCEPEEPVLGEGCTKTDLAAARAPDDRDRGKRGPKNAARAQVLTIDADPQLPQRPTMIGVQCFDVPLQADSSILLVHMRDIGHVLAPEEAGASGTKGAWDREIDDDRVGGSGGVIGGVRRATSELDAALSYGGGHLSGGVQYDVTLEGSFGAGVDVTSTLGSAVNSGDQQDLPATPLGSFGGSADGFSSIMRSVPIAGSVSITNGAGTDIELGRLFARPRDLPRSCDVPIAIAADEQRQVRLDVRASDGGASIERPGLTVSIVNVKDEGDDRTGRVVVGSYLSRSGLPRYTLVDWTQQYESTLEVEGCDGATYTEDGAAPPSDQVPATPKLLQDALGSATEFEPGE